MAKSKKEDPVLAAIQDKFFMQVLDRMVALCSDYYWFEGSKYGSVLNDPDPESESVDPRYPYEGFIVFYINRTREERGLGEMEGSDYSVYDTFSKELGISVSQARVLDASLTYDEDAAQRHVNNVVLRRSLEAHWSGYIRGKVLEGIA